MLHTRLGNALDRRGPLFWALFGVGSVALLGFIDYATGPDIAWSFFYLVPIFVAAWFAGRRYGIGFSALSAVVWWVADVTSGRVYPHPLIGVWNAISRLGFFVVVTWLADALHYALDREGEMARVDFTTGALNSRAFMELLNGEVARCRRYGRLLSVAYLDLDDFKAINDRFGHHAGDDVLRLVAETIRGELRDSDVVARLGGDEFAVLLPETDSEGACSMTNRMRTSMLASLGAQGFPVTLSIGVLTCGGEACDAEAIVHGADALMYQVKNSGKNGVRCETWSAPATPLQVPSEHSSTREPSPTVPRGD